MQGLGSGEVFDNMMKKLLAQRNAIKSPGKPKATVDVGLPSNTAGSPAVTSDAFFDKRQYALDRLFGDLRTNTAAIQLTTPQYQKDEQAAYQAYLAQQQGLQ